MDGYCFQKESKREFPKLSEDLNSIIREGFSRDFNLRPLWVYFAVIKCPLDKLTFHWLVQMDKIAFNYN